MSRVLMLNSMMRYVMTRSKYDSLKPTRKKTVNRNVHHIIQGINVICGITTHDTKLRVCGHRTWKGYRQASRCLCYDLPSDRAYSPSCWTKPKLGSAPLRFDLMYWIASEGVHPYCAIRNAATTLTLRLIPSAQWTTIRAFGLLRRASRIQAVVVGRCPASSAKGRSSTRTCRCRGDGYTPDPEGMRTLPEMTESTWVMAYDDRHD